MNRARWTALVLLVSLAVALIFDLDHRLAGVMATLPAPIVNIFRFITQFGEGGVVLVPTGLAVLIALWLKPRRPQHAAMLDRLIRRGTLLFTAVAFAGLANNALKIVFGRARPRLWLSGETDGFTFWHFGSDYASFPSGHTTTSVTAALVLSALFPRWRLAFMAFAIVIAASRIILNAHYLSDVIAGGILGSVCALVVLRWFARKRWWPA